MTRNTKKLVFNSVRAAEINKREGRRTDWLAKKCRVSESSIREYFRGSRNPSAAVVALMALALDCDESELLSESKNHAA